MFKIGHVKEAGFNTEIFQYLFPAVFPQYPLIDRPHPSGNENSILVVRMPTIIEISREFSMLTKITHTCFERDKYAARKT